jgi:UDP-N-acetylmuramoyl-tripeptide--D-alanyl-D-alanine ligase
MFSFLAFLWFFHILKAVLFYVYLWQLKEYHSGRFLAHFSTAKGKSLIFNSTNIFKISLLLLFYVLPLWVFFLATFLYLFEFFKFFLDIITRKLRKPVFTAKAIFLLLVNFIIEGVFIFLFYSGMFSIQKDYGLFAFWILLLDILAPVWISLAVLLLQPITVFMRNRIINKARLKREKFPNLLVVGVTGSYGKTSTKEFLYSILADKFGRDKILKTSEHQNSEVGISQCVLNNLNENHKIFVVEMGAYNRGGIKLLCSIVKPKIGVLTGINEQHMATFGSQENIIKGKYELIESLPKGCLPDGSQGAAFFNGNNKYCADLYNETLRRGSVRAFSYGRDARFFGEENIFGAIAAAKELGMTEEEIKTAVDKIENKMPGIKVKEGTGGLKIIDATYSANPDGVIANLEYLRNNFNGNPSTGFRARKIIVMPCLIELGGASKEVHKRIGKKIAEVCDLAVITTLDRLKEIKEGAASAEVLPSQKCEVIFMENQKKIFEKVKSTTKSGDAVLLESRVPKQLIKQLADNN